MKIEDMARGGLLAVGLVGLAAGAALGVAAGMAMARDPQAVRRVVRRAARGLEAASLMAAQAREEIGDLWADARETARAELDEHDFERRAAAATPAVDPKPASGQRPRRARKPSAPAPAPKDADQA